MNITREIERLTSKLAAVEFATPEQANALEHFLKMEQHNVHPDPDRGTCVLGNGISIAVLEPRKRKPTKRTVFRNPWSQCEQREALYKMMEAAKHKFPEIAHLIRYEAGVMD